MSTIYYILPIALLLYFANKFRVNNLTLKTQNKLTELQNKSFSLRNDTNNKQHIYLYNNIYISKNCLPYLNIMFVLLSILFFRKTLKKGNKINKNTFSDKDISAVYNESIEVTIKYLLLKSFIFSLFLLVVLLVTAGGMFICGYGVIKIKAFVKMWEKNIGNAIIYTEKTYHPSEDITDFSLA